MFADHSSKVQTETEGGCYTIGVPLLSSGEEAEAVLAKIVFDVEATKKLVYFVYRSSKIVISIIQHKVKHSYATYHY